MKFYTLKQKIFIVLIFILLALPSCFEIIEEINMNPDGSGSFCYTINLNQSKLNINSLFLIDSINGRPMPKKENIEKTFIKVEERLKQENDLSNIKLIKNWNDYIFTISGSFANIKSLNKAIYSINEMLNQSKADDSNIHENYSYSNNEFKRFNHYNLLNMYNSMNEKDKVIFNHAKFTAIYRFQNQVKSISNTDAIKSKSGKAVMLKLDIIDMIKNVKSVQNNIHLN